MDSIEWIDKEIKHYRDELTRYNQTIQYCKNYNLSAEAIINAKEEAEDKIKHLTIIRAELLKD